MHLRHPRMHIAIDSLLQILSLDKKFFVCRHVSIWRFWNLVCLSVCPYLERRNYPNFVNINPTVVIMIHQWKGLHEYYRIETYQLDFIFIKGRNWILTCSLTCAEELKSPWLRQYQSYSSNCYIIGEVFTSTTGNPKILFFLNAYLSVSAVMFCIQFLAYSYSAHW